MKEEDTGFWFSLFLVLLVIASCVSYNYGNQKGIKTGLKAFGYKTEKEVDKLNETEIKKIVENIQKENGNYLKPKHVNTNYKRTQNKKIVFDMLKSWHRQ